ncbi:hypothetical protein NQZ68_034843 [Dissostichus eleginoides]|nr:hypothetical protein NQZ68_034843 [Dissostichus eleginoides]
MGLVRLQRQVKGKDHFACEAKHHQSCFKSFRTAFANYERSSILKAGAKDTKQACILKITVSNAVARAYTLGTTDKYKNVALLLRQNILQAFRESKDLQWPPTADEMELTPENLLPTDLVRFLSMVMASKEDIETN